MNLVIIGFDNGLSPDRRQATFETNADVSLNEQRGTTLSEMSRPRCVNQTSKYTNINYAVEGHQGDSVARCVGETTPIK